MLLFIDFVLTVRRCTDVVLSCCGSGYSNQHAAAASQRPATDGSHTQQQASADRPARVSHPLSDVVILLLALCTLNG